MGSHNFSYQDINIPYTEAGQGSTVVLLHGFAETGEVWHHQVSYLQQHCRVIVPEFPAAAWRVPNAEKSASTVYQLAASIDAMADGVAALLKNISDEPVILLGHSMGGYTALAVAEKYPHLLKAFGLVHSTAFADTEEKKETRRKGIAFIRKNGIEAFFKTSAPGLFSEQSKQLAPEWIAQNVAMAVPFHPEILIANYEAMMARPDRTDVLAGSEVPVLFIIGMEDKAAPAADVLKQVHLPKVSYFHLLKNVSHMGMWEAADQVNSIILKFIADCG